MKEASVEDGWERLTDANDDIEAQLLTGVLEDAGIEARLVKNRSGYGDYLLGGSNAWAPVAVHVHESELAAARGLLDELRASPDPDDATPARVRYWPTLVAVVVVTLIVVLYVMEQRDLII